MVVRTSSSSLQVEPLLEGSGRRWSYSTAALQVRGSGAVSPWKPSPLTVTALMCESACCGVDCGAHGACLGNSGVCSCTGLFIGDVCDEECSCNGHGEQVDIDAARAAGKCNAGNCECTGLFIGSLCATECDCSGHGNQLNILAARSADTCGAGRCECTSDDRIGNTCSQTCSCGSYGHHANITQARATGSCDTEACVCDPGHINYIDDSGYYMSNCYATCGQHGTIADPFNATQPCICEAGYFGAICDTVPCFSGTHIDNGGIALVGYTNNMYCVSELSCSNPTSAVHLTFTMFDTEQGYDFVSIYDRRAPPTGQLMHQSGHALPVPASVDATGSHMTLVFQSDGSVSGGGFSATFTC